MSIFWDPRSRKPQAWIVPFFLILTVAICLMIYSYGNARSAKLDGNGKSSTGELK